MEQLIGILGWLTLIFILTSALILFLMMAAVTAVGIFNFIARYWPSRKPSAQREDRG